MKTTTFAVWVTIEGREDDAADLSPQIEAAIKEVSFVRDVVTGDECIVYDEHGNEIYNGDF